MSSPKFWLSREVFLSVALVALVAAPLVVFGGGKDIYVDKDNNGSEDGSSAHPYHSISQALEHADEGSEVFVAKGTYTENITVPKGVKLIGKKKDRGDVIIKADNDDKPTITMKHHSELDHLTVKDGRHGIRIVEGARALVYDVVVKDSERDGIHIDSASRDKKYQVSIVKTSVRDSKRAGIFAEKRNIVITESEIISNGSDGIDLAAGTKAWLEDNRVSDNNGSGLKVVLDNSGIWSKNLSIRNNKREGVEVNAFGAPGNVGLKKAALIGNTRYAVTRVARTLAAINTFGGIVYGEAVNANRLEGNGLGAVSPVISSF